MDHQRRTKAAWDVLGSRTATGESRRRTRPDYLLAIAPEEFGCLPEQLPRNKAKRVGDVAPGKAPGGLNGGTSWYPAGYGTAVAGGPLPIFHTREGRRNMPAARNLSKKPSVNEAIGAGSRSGGVFPAVAQALGSVVPAAKEELRRSAANHPGV